MWIFLVMLFVCLSCLSLCSSDVLFVLSLFSVNMLRLCVVNMVISVLFLNLLVMCGMICLFFSYLLRCVCNVECVVGSSMGSLVRYCGKCCCVVGVMSVVGLY